MTFGVNTWVSPTTTERLAGLAPEVEKRGFDLIESGGEDRQALDYARAAVWRAFEPSQDARAGNGATFLKKLFAEAGR